MKTGKLMPGLRRCLGSEFQALGQATMKARGPIVNVYYNCQEQSTMNSIFFFWRPSNVSNLAMRVFKLCWFPTVEKQ